MICLKCGECCKLAGKIYCIHLDRKTMLCEIYENRIGAYCGTIEGKDFYCTERRNAFIIPNCKAMKELV